MLRSEWDVFADSVASSLASSVGESPPHLLKRLDTQELPPSDSSVGGLTLASTMFSKRFRVCVVAGLSRISSSVSTGSVYVAEAGLLMVPLTHADQPPASLAVAPSATTPVALLPQLYTPLSVHFALRGRCSAIICAYLNECGALTTFYSPIGVSSLRAASPNPSGSEVHAFNHRHAPTRLFRPERIFNRFAAQMFGLATAADCCAFCCKAGTSASASTCAG